MTAVVPDSDMRKMFVKVPFGLDFKVYLFNVTNPMEVQKGSVPNLKEIGPFCYKEWKEKVELSDDEEDDTISYKSIDTFTKENGAGCHSGEEIITILHPLIVGMVNTVSRTKPAMLSLINKAINSVYRQPGSVYLTAKANDILFEGVIIDCNVKDFAGKAICSQLSQAPDLKRVSDTELAFSLLGPKNATPGKVLKVYRGKKKFRNLGKIIEFDNKNEMEIWSTKECNQFEGTDGTIFPPFLTKEMGLASFAPDICRSLIGKYEMSNKYDGIPVWIYSASFGDMSKNADEKCFCPSNDTCLKKGIMDLFKCVGVPIYASLPHFYDSDISYLNGVKGLKPNKEKHGIEIQFEHMTGGPLSARKRLMFSMPLEQYEKVVLFKELPNVVHPIFWIEEGVSLNSTFTKPIKNLFLTLKIVKIVKWTTVITSLIGVIAAGYLMYISTGKINVTPIHKVKPSDRTSPISRIGKNGNINNAFSEDSIDKY